jgi:hypothetical protein
MSTYQVHLLLEALVRVHSLEELENCCSIVSQLHHHLGLTIEEGEIVVEGAAQLKRLRMDAGECSSERIPLQ